MFKHPFTTEGRITRTEYVLSCILAMPVFILFVYASLELCIILKKLGQSPSLEPIPIIISLIIIGYFLWCQRVKRCHDLGYSRPRKMDPFSKYELFLKDGQVGTNEYGSDPKKVYSNNN